MIGAAFYTLGLVVLALAMFAAAILGVLILVEAATDRPK